VRRVYPGRVSRAVECRGSSREVKVTKTRPSKATRDTRAATTVDELLATLAHPSTPIIQAVRRIVLDAVPGVREEVKWNAPSFRTTEHFATFHLRGTSGVQLVLHLGAKPRPDAGMPRAIDDAAGLLQWKGPDRATIVFTDVAHVERVRDGFTAILRQWVTHVR
jgi:hypothetical protein